MARMPLRSLLILLALSVVAYGCGSTKSRLATEQLLVSDAVDEVVSSIDFRSLAGEIVYFDTRYLVNAKGVGFVNSEYIISSLRQQMIAADLRLKDKLEDADYVVEARIGTLGSDGNEIVYGIPANKGLSEASNVLPNVPTLPAIPEISVARKESQLGAVKVAAFAYERKTGSAVWQSGIARARTTSQDVWLFGAGPFQRGSIHTGTRFAGGEIRLPGAREPDQFVNEFAQGPPVAFAKEFYFPRLPASSDGQPPVVAKHPAPPSELSPATHANSVKPVTQASAALPSAAATPSPPPGKTTPPLPPLK